MGYWEIRHAIEDALRNNNGCLNILFLPIAIFLFLILFIIFVTTYLFPGIMVVYILGWEMGYSWKVCGIIVLAYIIFTFIKFGNRLISAVIKASVSVVASYWAVFALEVHSSREYTWENILSNMPAILEEGWLALLAFFGMYLLFFYIFNSLFSR